MADREKVIKGLETCINACHGKTVCLDCGYSHDYGGGCETKLLQDALALLKTQDFQDNFIGLSEQAFFNPSPRVMTLEEVQKAEVVWLEDRNGYLMEPVLIMLGSDMNGVVAIVMTTVYGVVTMPNDKYGITFRCWTGRPTKEQKEATPWET